MMMMMVMVILGNGDGDGAVVMVMVTYGQTFRNFSWLTASRASISALLPTRNSKT